MRAYEFMKPWPAAMSGMGIRGDNAGREDMAAMPSRRQPDSRTAERRASRRDAGQEKGAPDRPARG
jgi:hypothetical protein